MLPEQQQRILGYFLEEANDHLNTIEQGLLNLQSTLADSEMVNEIFRAAHSIKGGAAMLGLNSIQRTAHRLEDFFKILKECPSIQIEQTLESLFLQVFDNLKALLEQLQSGSSLSDGEASRLMSEVEPVFVALEHQLSVLVAQAGGSMHPDELPIPTATANVSGIAIAPPWAVVFEHSVPEGLRELLQLFKQPETSQTRQELQDCCTRLAQLGEEYNLSGWLTLCETAAGAIANADNSYRTLAPVIIRELKQAQDLILANRAAEITTCEQLQALSINTFLLDWEEENTNLTSFELEENQFTENLAIASEAFTPPAVVDNEVGFIPQGQIDSLSVDDDLSSLFIHRADSSNQWQETTDLLDVLHDSSDSLSIQDLDARTPISSEETLALNNLFGEAQDTVFDSFDEEPAFCNLFSAPTAELESVTPLEELNPVGSISENADLNQFWTEETDLLVQDETPSHADEIDSPTGAIAPAEVQFELGTLDDVTIPQVEETWSAASDSNLGAIADFTDGIAASIDDSNVTEPATAWNSEGLGLDFHHTPVIEINSHVSSIADSIAAESSLGWDDRSEGQLDLDLPAMELDDNLSLETEFNLEPLAAPADDSNPGLMAEWDAGSEAFETDFDTVMELGDRPSLESESTLEFSDNLSLVAEPDFNLFATSTPSNTDESSDRTDTLMSGWETDSEEPELSFATAADLFVSSAAEEIAEIAVPNFLPEESTTEISAEDTELMAEGDASSETLEMGFDSDAVESDDSLNLELELNSDLLTDAAQAPADDLSSAELTLGWDAENAVLEMPVDDESATASIAWDAGEAELSLGFDANSFESEESLNLGLEPNLELDENLSLVTETPAEDTALMAGWDAENAEPAISDDATASTEDIELMAEWDASNETLDTGSFDSVAIELGDRLSVDESSSELFRLSALLPVDDEIDDEIDDETAIARIAWDAGEAELNLVFDATPQESEETPSFELEPNLGIDDNFSLVAETPAEDTALMAEWDAENVALEMSVDAVTSTEDTELMAQWDAGSETLEMGFDSDALESDDSLNLELELNSDLLTDAAQAPADDLGNAELMAGWDVDNAALEMHGDDEGNASSIAWDTGEAELNLGFDATATDSEETPSFEPESNLKLDDNFSLMTESDADLFSSSTAAIIDENITELMSVVESIYQNDTENEISLEAAQADFLADSHLEADDDFPELDALLQEEESVTNAIATAEALLDLSSNPITPAIDVPTATASSSDDFGDLDLLLQETPKAATVTNTAQSSSDDFGDLDLLLQTTPAKPASVVPTPPAPAPVPVAATPSPRRPAFEQMMRVPVKQLDSIGNMVGELVVYRNSLEQDQERLRQFLDNLLHQVQQLGDVGTRMQELYERSLLEASLLTSRQGGRLISVAGDDSTSTEGQHATGANFDALEMDRFTGFHTLAQEMIELIVRVREASSDIEFVTGETEQVARNFRQVTTHLQEGITRSRMVPFSQIAERLPRAVRDIALKYGKQAELQVEGNETLIDKGILEQLYDPMTHLVNNAITHGIETPEERIAKGKAAAGKITIRAFYQGNQTVITVSDDGAGIDPEKVKAKATANGLITPAEADSMDRLDAFNLIFQPGFSTKEQVDQFAGRGIGMDVVLTSLKQMRGVIHTDSNLGKGTNFTIRLPLTLSICKALCCVSDKARIAFPMDGVEQMIDIPVDDVVTNAEGQTCIPWRDSLLPFRPLKELLGFTRQLGRGSIYGSSREDNAISIVILRSADTFFALQVDQVLGEQEIVIKQFEAPAPKPVGIAGATILGDGRIMPIADVLELIDLSVGRIQKDGRGTVWSPRHIPAPPMPTTPVKTEPLVLIIDDSITVRELLSMTFTNAGYRVEQARDGQEAWDKLRDGLPCDLVFCDIEMPRMDGLELLSRMQKEERLSQLPIAMLTSRGSDRHRQMALQLGASGYFTKPYLEEALLDGAQRMLRGEVLIAASTASSSSV